MLAIVVHDASKSSTVVIRQTGRQFCHTGLDGGDVKRLTDDTCGGDYHVVCRNGYGIRYQTAHRFRNLNAVGIAGVGITTVADDRLCRTVRNVLFRDGKRSAFDQVGGIYGGGGCGNLTPLDDVRASVSRIVKSEPEYLCMATHEEYWFKHYFAYQPDSKEKLMRGLEVVRGAGYKFMFIEDKIDC